MDTATSTRQPVTIDELPPVLRIGEVARFLRCDPSTVYDMVARGDLPVIRLGRVFRVSREALGRFVAGETPGAD